MGRVSQPYYLNCVVKLRTRLKVEALLQQTQRIERYHGRSKSYLRWGPRRLDLDILVYGDQSINMDNLMVPHPGIPTREFVLYPLKDIEPSLYIPTMGSLSSLLSKYRGPKPRRIKNDNL